MSRASTILFWFSLTIFVSLGLYHTSYRVEELGRQLRALNAQIEAEQRNIHVLKAEWVYLANPARIETAARKHLALQPTAPQQVAKLTRLSSVLPTRTELAAAAGKKAVASLEPRPVARTPKSTPGEAGRVNTHMVIRAAAQTSPLEGGRMALVDDSAYTLVHTETAP